MNHLRLEVDIGEGVCKEIYLVNVALFWFYNQKPHSFWFLNKKIALWSNSE